MSFTLTRAPDYDRRGAICTMGKTGAGGAGKLVEINGITKEFEGKTVRGAAEVRKQAHEYGARQLKKGWANTEVAAEIMKQLWKARKANAQQDRDSKKR